MRQGSGDALKTMLEPGSADAIKGCEQWFHQRVQKAIESAGEGKLMPGEQVEALMASRRKRALERLRDKS